MNRVLHNLAGAGLLLATLGAAAADEVQQPRTVISKIDWDAAVAGVADRGGETTAQTLARLNAIAEKRFPNIAKSAAPVLLPLDIAALKKDQDAGHIDATGSDKYFGGFVPTKFWLPGPAGYDATFKIPLTDPVVKTRFKNYIEIQITGASYVYELDEPNHTESVTEPKALQEKFPGIRRILAEAHVRYAFERSGTPYVVSIQCYDMRPSSKHLSCKEADPIALKFLDLLQLAGGTPADTKPPKLDLSRPETKSDFTYYSPGDLIENSGWKKMPGRADYYVYSVMRSPIAESPSYVKSQSFNSWGDCYRRGVSGRTGKKGAQYHCKVNDKPLVFDESASENFTYPWRDNFCEYRDFLVGQCPGGYGHQGEDIRPGNCVLKNPDSDRCLPYQHDVAAVHDGLIWRTAGNIGVYIVTNTENEHVRFRYLHMNPNYMDQEGWVSGRTVKAGEIMGKVADWGDFENGTSYHIHFNMQVFTRNGWVWVNPYMSLVLAYERQIGGRGTEIKAGDPAPVIPDKPPIVLNPGEPKKAAEAPNKEGEQAAKKAAVEEPTKKTAKQDSAKKKEEITSAAAHARQRRHVRRRHAAGEAAATGPVSREDYH